MKFTPNQRKELLSKGFLIYSLSGKSIKELRDEGNPFWSSWHEGKDFENEKGFEGEVAFNPKELLLPDSNNKTSDEQLALVSEIKALKGTKAIMGSASTYCELTFLHYKKTENRLFGKDYDYNYTRTTTETGESYVAYVGDFDADDGLDVGHWFRGSGDGDVFVAPLYVLLGVDSGKLRFFGNKDLGSASSLHQHNYAFEKMEYLNEEWIQKGYCECGVGVIRKVEEI